MATASKFTKVTLIQQLKLDEAEALIKFMELVPSSNLTTVQKQLVVTVYQSMKKAMDNGRD